MVHVFLPEVVTYNTLMSACEKGRDYDAAERVMSEMYKWAACLDRAAMSAHVSHVQQSLQGNCRGIV